MLDVNPVANIFTAILLNRIKIAFLSTYVYLLINFSKSESGWNHAKCHRSMELGTVAL